MRRSIAKDVYDYSEKAKKKIELEDQLKEVAQTSEDKEVYADYLEKSKTHGYFTRGDMKSIKNITDKMDEMAEKIDEKRLLETISDLEGSVRLKLESVARQKIVEKLPAREHIETKAKEEAEIFLLQKEKQMLMDQLKSDLKNIDNLEIQQGERMVKMKKLANGKDIFIVEDEKGKEREATLGEVMTDGEWGVDYYLSPDSVDKKIRKRFVIEKYKKKLSDLLDKQIITYLLSQEKIYGGHRDALEEIKKRLSAKVWELSPGIIAEKMERLFLTKLSYDYPELNLSIYRADLSDDIDLKTDFVIIKEFFDYDINQNVKTVENEGGDVGVKKLPKSSILKERIGVQLTTIPEDAEDYDLQKRFQAKKKQIGDIKFRIAREKNWNQSDGHKYIVPDDIVLVSLPIQNVKKSYSNWLKAGRPPGGPDKMISLDAKEKMFVKVLGLKHDKDEIMKEWNIIKKDYSA